MGPRVHQKQFPSHPKNWPPHITFLSSPIYSKLLSGRDFDAIHHDPSSVKDPLIESNVLSRVLISPITTLTHPAHGQHGLMATSNLLPDSFIIFYFGFVHGPGDVNLASDYDLSFDREIGLGIDATTMGNESRFINDYRGIREAGSNAEFRDCWARLPDGDLEKRIGVYVLSAGKSGKRVKGIGKGEEIVVSYGKGFWEQRRKEERA